MTDNPTRPACAPPRPDWLNVEHNAPGHPGGFYWSTYCMHGLPDQCRSACKICHKPCGCACHLGGTEPFPGFSLEQEDELRQVVRGVCAELGVQPGPRSRELITDIVTSVLHRIDKEAAR